MKLINTSQMPATVQDEVLDGMEMENPQIVYKAGN
jgi:hypothetical protein